MSISSILDIAKSGIFASQFSIQTTSHNIANVNTEGYARQAVVLSEAIPATTAQGFLGQGVRADMIITYYDKYLEKSIAAKNGSLLEQEGYSTYLERIETILNEDNTKLASYITEFFNAWQELATDPTSTTIRATLVSKGQNLTRSIRNIYSELKGLQFEVDRNVQKEVEDINTTLSSIADLNKRVSEATITGTTTGDYSSERANLLKRLSGGLGVISLEDEFGRITVMTDGGKVLVEGDNAWAVDVIKDEATGLNRIVWKDQAGNSSDITESITTGKLKALLDIRDNYIVDFIDQINGLAEAIIKDVNEIHATGYNLNNTTGINFFKDIASDYAMAIDVSDEVIRDANNIAATSSPDRPSDNDIALAIAGLGEKTLTINGSSTTFVSYVSSIQSKIGEMAGNASNLYEYEQNTMNIMEKQRDSISGVSLDEEMSDLIKFQYAYQAAARLIVVADELFKSILEIMQ